MIFQVLHQHQNMRFQHSHGLATFTIPFKIIKLQKWEELLSASFRSGCFEVF